MKLQLSLLLFFLLLCIKVNAQKKEIYILTSKYNLEARSLINSPDFNFKEIKLLNRSHIDPKKIDEIDYSRLKKYLIEFYPDDTEEGVLCIDLENKNYRILRTTNKKSSEYENASSQFITLIKYIKSIRPNLKVGIYGMPFRFYYDSQADRNNHKVLDPILKHTDVIFPSLYIFYPAEQKGIDANYEYFKKNLDVAFDYAYRLDKLVAPFFWYLVHPSNNRGYGYEALPKKEVEKYLNFISTYKSESEIEISGIVWWDTPTTFNNRSIKYNLLKHKKDNKIKFNDLNESFEFYKSILID